jgi:hypothetical protein
MSESHKLNRNFHKTYHGEHLVGLLSILEEVVDVKMSQEERRQKCSTPRLLPTVNAVTHDHNYHTQTQ